MRRLLLILVLVLGLPLGAGAITIDFGGLIGTNGSDFTSYVEEGFQVAETSGDWVEAQQFGGPLPSIFSTSLFASVDVTSVMTNILFSAQSVDVASALRGSTIGYTIEGFLGGASQYSFSGGQGHGFGTIALAGTQIDVLRITIDKRASSSYNIDNIVVERDRISQPVPEPGAAILMLAGLVVAERGIRRAGRRQVVLPGAWLSEYGGIGGAENGARDSYSPQ